MSEFYIGYLPKAPASTARFIKTIVAALVVLGAVVGLLLVLSQMPFAQSFFEFGKLGDFEGVILKTPYPTLLVGRPQSTASSQYLLVAPGKHGAENLVSEFDGKRVRLRGQLIYRDGNTMVEVDPGSIASIEPVSGTAANTTDLGPVMLTGEIVDSKCYLGVMNPGRGKVHRDCASRCISGGIPPALLTSSGEIVLLLNRNGNKFAQDALREFIGEPVVVRGELVQRENMKMVRAINIQRSEENLKKVTTHPM